MLSGEQNAIGTKFLILVQSMESMLFMSIYNIAIVYLLSVRLG